MNAYERETVVNASDGDETIRILTAQRRFLSRLRANQSFTEVRSWVADGSEWAEFTIPASSWNPASGAKRKRPPLSDEHAAKLRAGRHR